MGVYIITGILSETQRYATTRSVVKMQARKLQAQISGKLQIL